MADFSPEATDEPSPPREVRLRDDWHAVAAVCLFLVTIVWLAFGQTLRHAFINYDDNIYVYQNTTVLAGLTGRGIRWAFAFAEIGHWHPVTWLSHMVDCWLFGLRPGGHHLTNVALHASAACLLFLAVKQMTGAFWRSAFVAALFAIHPQRVESVAWIAERKDVLGGAFFMATILAYLQYVKRRPSGSRYALVVLLFALGLMSKGMLVTLPFVLLLLDYWPLGRLKAETIGSIGQPESRALIWRLIVEKIPLFLLSAASCVATRLSPEEIAPALRMSFPERIENAIVSYVIYLKQMFYPAGLTLPYFNPAGGFTVVEVVLSAAILVAVSLAALVFWKTRPYLAVGWFWYLGMMLPVIGLVQISYYARADRYTYLPQIGLYILLAWSAAELTRGWRFRRAILAVAALLAIAVLTRIAHAQTANWRDSETLWWDALRKEPEENYIAWNNMGLVLEENGDFEGAIRHYEVGLTIQPSYAELHNNFGNALAQAGRVQEAIAHYEKALELVPGVSQVHNNFGTALGQNGQLPEAIAQFQKALEISPGFSRAHGNLGFALFLKGETEAAERELRKAIEINPNAFEPHKHLGDVLVRHGRAVDAIAHYRRALELRPDDAEARRGLDAALAP